MTDTDLMRNKLRCNRHLTAISVAVLYSFICPRFASARDLVGCFRDALLGSTSSQQKSLSEPQLFSGHPGANVPHYSRIEAYSWKIENYRQNMNHAFYVGDQSAPQELLGASFFSKPEQSMFRDLFNAAEKPRNQQRQVLRNNQPKLDQRQSIEVTRIQRKLQDKGIQMSTDQIRSRLGFNEEKPSDIEFGFIELHFKNGKTVNVKTSSYHPKKINPDDTFKSIQGTIAELHIDSSELTGISYFHNHPSAGPLSDGDMSLAKHLTESIAPQAAPGFRVDMYAVGKPGGGNEYLTFHTAFVSP
jgi:hypothetical protein